MARIPFSLDWLYQGVERSNTYKLTEDALTVAAEWQALSSDKRVAYKTLIDSDAQRARDDDDPPAAEAAAN